jgi:hypothetical protein
MATKMTILILSLTLSGCMIPEYREMDRYAVTKINGELICARQRYDLNKFEKINNFVQVDFSFCEDMLGFSLKDWTEEVTPKGREIYNWVNDNCNPNRTE